MQGEFSMREGNDSIEPIGAEMSGKKLKEKKHSPRRVLIQPSDIPSRMHEGGKDEASFSPQWVEGDMLWGKLRGYPYWPCMVSRDPFTKLYVKCSGSYKLSRSYHVQFFGTEAERSWINESSLLVFEGREKFMEIMQFGLENPGKGCKSPNSFIINTYWHPVWSLAVSEAEVAFGLSNAERNKQYAFEYVCMIGEEEKSIGVLLLEHGLGRDDDPERESRSDKKDFSQRGRGVWYDSDDFCSLDNSSDEREPERTHTVISVRLGQFDIFLARHARYVGQEHLDWDQVTITEFLRQQWCLMSQMQRNRYTSRLQQPIKVETKSCRHQTLSGMEDLAAIDPWTLDLEIVKLSSSTLSPSGKYSLCIVCGTSGDLKICEGSCGGLAHTSCAKEEGGVTLCTGCYKDSTFGCFSCGMTGSSMMKCAHPTCSKVYHQECIQSLQLKWSSKDGFTCPLHVCATCALNNLCKIGESEGMLSQCVRCPVAFHRTDFCVPAGSLVLTDILILCPAHFAPNKIQSQHSGASLRKCLACGGGGPMQRCKTCPAVYHAACGVTMESTSTNAKVKNSKPEWMCKDCTIGKRPLYGDIVWAKLGCYRWWPSEVCHPLHVPLRVRDQVHGCGEFPVRFFGSHDFAWLHRGRVYPFAMGNHALKDVPSNSLDGEFCHGMHEAAVAMCLWTGMRRKKARTSACLGETDGGQTDQNTTDDSSDDTICLTETKVKVTRSVGEMGKIIDKSRDGSSGGSEDKGGDPREAGTRMECSRMTGENLSETKIVKSNRERDMSWSQNFTSRSRPRLLRSGKCFD